MKDILSNCIFTAVCAIALLIAQKSRFNQFATARSNSTVLQIPFQATHLYHLSLLGRCRLLHLIHMALTVFGNNFKSADVINYMEPASSPKNIYVSIFL